MTADPADSSDFSRWRRTSPFAIVFFVKETIQRIRFYGQLLVTFGLAFLIVRARELAGELIPAAILLIIAVAVLRYWFFRFRVTGDRRDPRDLLRYMAGQFGYLEPISRDEVPHDLVSNRCRTTPRSS